jgi:tetratricopeptide (TPR) repeat protein
MPAFYGALELLSALLALERNNFAAVRQSALRVEKNLPEVAAQDIRRFQAELAHLLAGTAEVRAGNLDAARAHLQAQKQWLGSWEPEKWWLHALEAEIALAAGDWESAETALAAGMPRLKMMFSNSSQIPTIFCNNLPFGNGLARLRKARGDRKGAIEAYRELLAPDISSKWTAMLEPRYVLELARLLEESGERNAARREYQRFLELWKDADPSLPEMAEARRKIREADNAR